MKARLRKTTAKGIICLPMYRNVPDAGESHPDWELKFCPSCGALCWESDLARQKKKEGLRAEMEGRM